MTPTIPQRGGERPDDLPGERLGTLLDAQLCRHAPSAWCGPSGVGSAATVCCKKHTRALDDDLGMSTRHAHDEITAHLPGDRAGRHRDQEGTQSVLPCRRPHGGKSLEEIDEWLRSLMEAAHLNADNCPKKIERLLNRATMPRQSAKDRLSMLAICARCSAGRRATHSLPRSSVAPRHHSA